MNASKFILRVVLLSTIGFNILLFSFVVQNSNILSLSGLSIAVSIFTIVFILTLLVSTFLALISPLVFKLFWMVSAILNSIAIYYMWTYQTVLDRTMMGNVFNTRFEEYSELITISLFLLVLIVGVVPAWLVLRVRIVRVDRLKLVSNACIALVLSIVFLYLNSPSWLWIDKYASLLGGKILPWSYIINSGRYYTSTNRSIDEQELLPDGQFTDDKKVVFVLVIGETARADNFSLYDYLKETNPKLNETSNLIALNNTKSCTTYTTGSLACILSPGKDYLNFEVLPTYLTRHGAEVIWRTNNWGEPPISVSSYVEAKALRPECNGEGCHLDEVLLTNLNQVIEASEKKKVLIVLHTKGSHGPSYYKRYTKEFERFEPVCRDEEISKCSREELINAYDNTILYTDHFLASLIEQLKQLTDVPTAMMYISDHGESLGEHGLYLHGTPYTFAPDFQKNIPFLLWMSEPLQVQQNISLESLEHLDQHSQFNVFHTVLGVLGFQSTIYKRQLDVTLSKSS